MARRKDVEDKLIGHIRAPRKNVLLALFDEIAREATTPAGVIVPQNTAADRMERVGTVIATGGEIAEVEPGDRLLLDKRLGYPVPHADDDCCKLVMISEDQILGILTGEPEREDYDLVKHGLRL